MHQPADRNLLFGILALQMELIDRDQLVDGMHRWVADKNQDLGRVLVAAGALEEASRRLLEELLEKRIERHDGDVEESLASYASIESSLKEELQLVDDWELSQTIARIPPARWGTGAGPRENTGSERFAIIRFHARGGLGEVFVAEDRELHRDVALKQINGVYADQPESRSRFLAEAEITAGLEHPNIVPVYGLGQSDDGRPYYAMKLIRGESLRKRIDQFHYAVSSGEMPVKERSLALRDLLNHFVDVCHAVEYAHSRGVIHRDLKPSNVMLGRYGETLVVDWGLAKSVGRADGDDQSEEDATLRPSGSGSSADTIFGRPLGTLPYASPEQVSGQVDQMTPLGDVYSLGATLYAILSGVPPFKGTAEEIIDRVKAGAFSRPRKVNPRVPPALEAICLKAMSFKPENRYGSPSELAREVNAWLADERVEAYAAPLATRLRRWLRRHRVMAVGTATALAVAMLGMVIGTALLSVKNRQLTFTQTKLQTTNRRLESVVGDLRRANDDIRHKSTEISVQNRRIEAQNEEITLQRDKAQQSYEDAVRSGLDLAVKRGQWEAALSIADHALKEGFSDPVGLRIRKVTALYGLIRTKECVQEIEALSRLADKGSHEAEIDLWRGDMRVLRDRDENASELIRSAIEKGLPPAEEHYARALIEKNTLQIIEELKKAIELDTFHQRAFHCLIANLVMLGRRDEARATIAMGKVLFPKDPNFTLLEAWVAAMEGNAEEAERICDQLHAWLGEKDFGLARRLFANVAKFVHYMDHWEGGLSATDFFRILGLVKDFQTISTTGVHATESGNPWSLELRVSNSTIGAYTSIVSSLTLKSVITGNLGLNVAQQLGESTRYHPDGFLQFIRGVIYVNRGMAEEAVDAFQAASTLSSLVPNVQREALYCLCMSQQMLFLKTQDQSLLEPAVESLRKRLAYGRLNSSHASTVWNLCIRQKEWELARTIAQQQIDAQPNAVDWIVKLATVERLSGRPFHAIELVQQALRAQPGQRAAEQLRTEVQAEVRRAVQNWVVAGPGRKDQNGPHPERSKADTSGSPVKGSTKPAGKDSPGTAAKNGEETSPGNPGGGQSDSRGKQKQADRE